MLKQKILKRSVINELEEYTYFDEHNSFFSSEEKRLVKYINPLQYVLNNISNINNISIEVKRELMVNLLQNELHKILQLFLNGGFSERNYKFYPFGNNVSKFIVNRVLNLLPIVLYLKSTYKDFPNFLNSLEKIRSLNSKTSKEAFSSIISSFYCDFENIISELKINKTATKEPCQRFDIASYAIEDKEYLMPLELLRKFTQEHFSSFVSGFYLHGSMSTQDYIKGWSDVDTLIIIKKDTLINPKRLIAFRNYAYRSLGFFYLIDPYQMHGHFYITEYDMDYYPQNYFPLILFKYSKSILGSDKSMLFRVRNYELENIYTFWWDAVSYFRNKMLSNSTMFINDIGKQVRDKKLFIHRLLTFPLFYLQARGEHIYKRESFEKAKIDFSKELWYPIEKASLIRKDWEYVYKYGFIGRNIAQWNPLFFKIGLSRYLDLKYNNLSKYNNDYECILKIAFELSENAWRKILVKKKLG